MDEIDGIIATLPAETKRRVNASKEARERAVKIVRFLVSHGAISSEAAALVIDSSGLPKTGKAG